MDKYAVIKFYQYSEPTLLDTFDNESDANTYAEIMKRKDGDDKFGVFTLTAELQAPLMSTMNWWDEEANEILKTRNGLQTLIDDNNGLIGVTVYEAVRFFHIDLNWPTNML